MKPPFITKSLLKKIQKLNKQKIKKLILTWSRASTVMPFMIGHTLGVYNGRQHLPVFISEQMIGHKLGEFAPSRSFRSHVKSDKKAKRK
jgi:small subunit ribosomal protein S19